MLPLVVSLPATAYRTVIWQLFDVATFLLVATQEEWILLFADGVLIVVPRSSLIISALCWCHHHSNHLRVRLSY